MGDITEFFKRDLHIRGKALKVIHFSERAIAVIAGIETIVSAANVVLDLIDQSDGAKRDVDELIREFIAVTASSESVALMREVGLQIEDARTQASVVRSFLPGDINSESQRGDVLNNSERVVRTLGNSSFWLRPYFTEGVYSDAWDQVRVPWAPVLQPDPMELATEAKVVFDWRLTLPAYLEAIVIRLLILSALVDNYRVRHRAELLEMAERLQDIHDQISTGIKLHRAPEAYELQGTLATPPTWSLSRLTRLFGAVEVYSTANCITPYPQDPDIDAPRFDGQPISGEGYARFLVRHKLKSLRRWKSLYNDLGLAAIYSLIGHLRRLANHPSASNNAGAWSIREVNSAVTNITRQRIVGPDGSLQLRTLLSCIGNRNSVRQSLES
jgi:hypothetical protein